jgi:large subunit ribosomal protein L10
MNKDVLQAKKDSVKEISDNLKNSSTVAIVSYQGLTVAEFTELRRTLAAKKATMGVYKNTLVARALKDNKISGLDKYLAGPNAFVFSKEISVGPAVLYRFSRYHEKLVLKAAFVEGTVVDEKGFVEVAKLPSKEVLLSLFCRVLNEPVASFARAVKSVADSKAVPVEAPIAPAAAPAAN